jgi:hypothetical protein
MGDAKPQSAVTTRQILGWVVCRATQGQGAAGGLAGKIGHRGQILPRPSGKQITDIGKMMIQGISALPWAQEATQYLKTGQGRQIFQHHP